MNLYNQIKYNGYHIDIYYDDDARSPREMYDNLGTLYTAHRRYRPEKEFDNHFNIDEVFKGYRWTRYAKSMAGSTSRPSGGNRLKNTCKVKSKPSTTIMPGRFSGIASRRKMTTTSSWQAAGDSTARNA